MGNSKRFFKIFFDTLSTALMFISIGVLIFSIYTAYSFRDNPDESYLFGYKPVLVLTGSMEPTLRTNGVAIVKKTSFKDIKEKDILMYKIDGKMITHRVIEKTNKFIVTKGDNNKDRDAYKIGPENTRAVVVARLNFFSKPISEIFPDGIKGDVNKKGLIKWIGYPIFVIIVINGTCKIIRIINKKEEGGSEGEEE